VAFGASFLVASFVLAVSAATLVLLREAGYIPGFKQDMTAFHNFEAVGMSAYYECLRDESRVFNALYNGLGGSFDALSKPLDDLSWVQPTFHIAAALLFVALVFLASKPPKFIAASTATIACVVVFATIPLGLPRYDEYLYATTPCSARSIEAAGVRTAEDQIRSLAERHAKNVGRSDGPLTLTAVEPQQRSLIFRIRVSERATSRDHFEEWARHFRQKLVAGFCTSSYGAYYQRNGMSQVWVLRYADTELAETVVQSKEQCTR
jgi:hypothetical protein